jgi:hypothetical protein
MTAPTARPSTPSGLSQAYATKATDHALQKYDNFTRYGHALKIHAVPVVALFDDALQCSKSAEAGGIAAI